VQRQNPRGSSVALTPLAQATWRRQKMFKKLFCKHEYAYAKFIKKYTDRFAWTVYVYKCKCRKCGKRKTKKYQTIPMKSAIGACDASAQAMNIMTGKRSDCKR